MGPGKRAQLPDRAFAYIDSHGKRRLPIHDEAHVRNALARFNQVSFESEAAREKARARLLQAAKRYGIVPLGFITGQLEKERDVGHIRTQQLHAERLPTGEVTLMMTDLEGSTRLLRDLGDHYGEVLDQIREVVRSSVTAQGGLEVDARADEFFAAFPEARAALVAAITIRRRLKQAGPAWGKDVRMRIGLHTGRPTRRGASYIGMPVHTAARLCAAAAGGQILVSAETRRAVRGGGFRFRNLGERQLAGLPEASEIFLVLNSGAET